LDRSKSLGLSLHVLQASAKRDFDTVFATLGQLRAGGLVIGSDARERFVPGLVGVALVLAFIVNVSTRRTMCHDAGRSLDTAQIANMLRE
jgi:hypothetical protein